LTFTGQRAVIRQNFVHSQNQRFGDKVDAEYSGKILAMIAPLRHLLGWIVSAFGSREGLILENLALRQQLLALRQTTSPSAHCDAQAVLGRVAKALVWMEKAAHSGHP
jgi:hypothetical protein